MNTKENKSVKKAYFIAWPTIFNGIILKWQPKKKEETCHPNATIVGRIEI